MKNFIVMYKTFTSNHHEYRIFFDYSSCMDYVNKIIDNSRYVRVKVIYDWEDILLK